MDIPLKVPRDRIEQFCRRWKVAELALFGSVLRPDFGPESDVDVLLNFREDAAWDLFHWVQMQSELKRIFGREVHLVEEGGLRNPFRRYTILRSREVVYASR